MESRGLKKISRKKTSLQGQKVKIVATFKHLDSAVSVGGWEGGGEGGGGGVGGGGLGGGGGFDAEVAYRVQAGCRNWNTVSGVLCDIRLRGKPQVRCVE